MNENGVVRVFKPEVFWGMVLTLNVLLLGAIVVCQSFDLRNKNAELAKLQRTYRYIGDTCTWYDDGSVVCPKGTAHVDGAVPVTSTTTVAK